VAAGETAARGATTDGDRERAAGLFEARAHALLIVPVRLVLALAGLTGARVRGVSSGSSVALFGFAAGLTLFMLLASRRRRLFWQHVADAVPLDPVVPVAGWAQTVAEAMYPSTIGLTILTAIALPIDAELAAFLAGILAGLGLSALLWGLEIVTWERQRGLRLFLGTKRVYVR
jgi:hypothetical protein